MKSIIYALLLFAYIQCVFAIEYSPIHVVNQNPFALIHGIPNLGSSKVLKEKQFLANYAYTLSSHYSKSFLENEQLVIDGETTRHVISLRYGLKQNWEGILVVPYIRHDTGVLDEFIIDWHDAFGLPQSGRDETDNNQLLFRYQKNGENKIILSDPVKGFGDLTLGLAYQSVKHASHSSAIKATLKFSNANSKDLLGSGKVNLSAWFVTQGQSQLYEYTSGYHYGAGLMWLPKADVLESQQEEWVALAALGYGVQVFDDTILQLQWDYNSRLYRNSKLSELNGFASQLTIGGRTGLAKGWDIEIAVAEDLHVDVTPDVSFHIAINASAW